MRSWRAGHGLLQWDFGPPGRTYARLLSQDVTGTRRNAFDKCRLMSETRQAEPAVTLSRRMAGGTAVDAHRHDGNQIVYASRGVLSVTTDAGAWIAPGSPAIWVPAGAMHEHRAYGVTVLHTVGLPGRANPLRITRPAVLVVGPLLRELIIAYTHDPQEESPARWRLRSVLLDQLRTTPQQGIHLPSARDPRLAEVCDLLLRDPADPRGLAELGAAVGVSHRTLTRLFGQEMGMTFPQWRTQLRLHLALRLLAEGLPVTTVGHPRLVNHQRVRGRLSPRPWPHAPPEPADARPG